MEDYVVVRFSADYADEFDVYGLAVCSKQVWDSCWAGARTADYPAEKYFGTNEYLEYETFDDWERECTVTPVTFEAAEQFCVLLGEDPAHLKDSGYPVTWGHFLMPQ